MITLEKLIKCKGAERFGTCSGCGRMSDDDKKMIRIKAGYDSLTRSVCLCDDCRLELLVELLEKPYETEDPPTNSNMFQKIFGGRFVTDVWLMSPGSLQAWSKELWNGGKL